MVTPTHTRARATKGFTLIELLIVLAVIALMMTIALPNYFHSIDASKEKILAQNLLATREAIDRFYGDAGRYPESLQELVDKRYLRTLPVDPITDSTTSWHLVPPDEPLPGKVYDIHSGAQGSDSNGTPYEAL
jgi:general secretion pathway protein G